MVTTLQIKPSELLQPYISCYAMRVFNTGDVAMPRPMYATQESYLSFFLRERLCTITDDEGEKLRIASNSICNLFTHSQGIAWWKGDYKVLCVQFAANGLSAIFGIPQGILIDKILSAEDILGKDNELLTEQLAYCNDIFQMGIILNKYFEGKLAAHKSHYYTGTIAIVANTILKANGFVSFDRLAYKSNMSVRTFERRFSEEVGMPAKLYARIARFFVAVEKKMLTPEKNWTDITYEYGYFDQAHFIRECKEFSSKTPKELFKYTPPPKESTISLEV